MLRESAAVCALAILPLAGCASITNPPENGAALFEVEYVNFAWVPTWRGVVIDSTGAIHSYDLKGKPWQPKDNDFPTRAELSAKYATNSKLEGNVEPATFQAMQERARRAAAGPLSQPVTRCADAGTATFSAWLYDSSQDAFRRVLLRQEGDIARLNQSSDAVAVTEWLMSLQLVPRIQGCQP